MTQAVLAYMVLVANNMKGLTEKIDANDATQIKYTRIRKGEDNRNGKLESEIVTTMRLDQIWGTYYKKNLEEKVNLENRPALDVMVLENS